MPNKKQAVTPLSIAHRDRKIELLERAALLALKNEREEKEKKQNRRCYFMSWYLYDVIQAYPKKQAAWIDSVKQTAQTVTADKREQSDTVEFMKREYFSHRNAQANEYANGN